MRISTKIVLIFIAVFVLGGGLLLFVAYQGGLSRGLQLSLSVPEKITIGEPFDLRINVSNNSQTAFEDVRLTVSLPEGVAFVGSPASKNADFKELGILAGNSLNQQTFKLIALNGENTFKRVSASASYLAGSLSSRFQEEKIVDAPIDGYAIVLDIATPQQVFSGENFDAEISFKNESKLDFSDLRLRIDYPMTYKLIKANLPPDLNNNIWILGGLHPGSENKFKINGNLIGPDGASFELKATIQANFLGQNYDININTAAIAIATSPLSLKISLNNEEDYISRLNDSLAYTLSYKNNTDIGLRDVIIKAQLVGAMFDFSAIQTNGVFRSTDNTITWNASNVSDLSTLSPGESGSVFFILKIKNAYPIKRLSDKNFTLKITGTIESPTVPNFVSAEKTFSLATLETKVGGQADLDARAYFRDASSGVINKGPFPPKVNQPTQYTVHWLITNYSTDVKTVEVKAFLAGNVRYLGTVKNSSGTITYNDRTQELVWVIDRIPATTGIISSPLEAIFQIEATPSSADLGRFMNLIQESSLKAIDEFTDLELFDKDFPISTTLPDDSTASNQGIVIQ